MRKRLGIYCLSSLAILGLISSCSPTTSSSSSPTSEISDSSSSSSSSIDGHFDLWNDEEQALLKKYCGEVLPYPVGLLSGEVRVNEIIDQENSYSYLEIYDQSTSFTLEKYYETLKEFNWNVIETYLGRINRDNLVELTKADTKNNIGYEIEYAFSTNQEKEGYSNVIRCYNNLSSSSVSQDSWSTSELEAIREVTTIDLPFIKLGALNKVSAYSLDALQIYDYYTTDLSKEYAELLVNSGFSININDSKLNDCFVLEKTLQSGSIRALLSYYNGNNFIFYYTPFETTYTSWPKELFDQIEEKSGVEVPSFPIKEGGNYKAYVKNNYYVIYTTTKDDTFNYETYNNDILQFVGLSWEETISFASYNVTDSNSNIIGFRLVIKITSPTSTFTSSWPKQVIDSTFTNLGIDVELPDFNMEDLVETDKQIKYKIKGEETYNEWYENYYSNIKDNPTFYGLEDDASEEEIQALAKELAFQEQGIDVYLFDTNSSAFNSFENTLYKAGWYSYFSDEGNITYEDPTGQLAVTLDGGTASPSHDYQGQTSFLIHPGTNKAHTPEFEFKAKEVEAAIGLTTTLELNKKMLPYEVTYSSSDTTGKISVNNKGEVEVATDIKEGTKATITATLTDSNNKTWTATCEVVATKVTIYTCETAINLIGAKLKEKGYNPSIYHRIVGNDPIETDYLTLTLDSSIDVNEFKKIITSDLILDEFEVDGDWETNDIYIMDKEEQMPGEVINYKDIDMSHGIYLTAEYSLHVENNQTILQIVVY